MFELTRPWLRISAKLVEVARVSRRRCPVRGPLFSRKLARFAMTLKRLSFWAEQCKNRRHCRA